MNMKEPLIYLVDNDLISKFKIEIRIRQSNRPFNIISFLDALSAFDMLGSDFGHDRGVPDVIIANFDLPGMDGLSFLKAVEENDLVTERAALYIFSASRISDERKNYTELAQIKGFFVKPPSRIDIQKIFDDFDHRENGHRVR